MSLLLDGLGRRETHCCEIRRDDSVSSAAAVLNGFAIVDLSPRQGTIVTDAQPCRR
jgi:hypothetical protein